MSARDGPTAPLVVIFGSTGTGKSELAVDLAARFNGEVINADAMQLYKGLPIITNKIPPQDQRSIPHHLIGSIEMEDETWVVGIFKQRANSIIAEIRGRGRIPIVVGGTHYYAQSLLFRDQLVESSEPLRVQDNSVNHPILNDTTEAMWEKLKEVDPAMAEKWHPKDRRKIRRSLEICLTTGRPASEIYAEQQGRRVQEPSTQEALSNPDALLFWVHAEPDVLKQRLDERVDQMLTRGLMDEVMEVDDYLRSKSESGNPVDSARGIWQAIGFKEFQPYLRARRQGAGAEQLNRLKLESLEVMKTTTKRYAKYQVRWMKRQTLPMLREHGAQDRLYVLDSTDLPRFSEHVLDRAASLTQKFLAADPMPDPRSVSAVAKTVLDAAEASVSSSESIPCRKHCSVCDATLLTEEKWQLHIQGRGHRRKVRRFTNRTAALISAPDTKTELGSRHGAVRSSGRSALAS